MWHPLSRGSVSVRSAGARAEWCQFRLLCRDSIRRLVNAAMFARDADPAPAVIWVGAVVMAPPTLMAVGRLFEYGLLRAAPAAVYERALLGHRSFFVVYAMLAVALLTALLWEALLPDRTDLEVVGPLPVRARTMAAARLTAATALALGFAWAISLPSTVMFVVVSSTHPASSSLALAMAGHIAAITTGCLFVFFALLALRVALAFAAGATLTDRLSFVLQLLTVAALVEVVFYMPALQPVLSQQVTSGQAAFATAPPAWFIALYTWMAGTSASPVRAMALQGVLITAGAAAMAIVLALAAARTLARRALEAQDRQRPGATARLWRAATRTLVRSPVVCAVLRFTTLTLPRSRRHRLILASYAGLAVAIGGIDLLASGLRGGWQPEVPSRSLAMMPLALLFFAAVGLRAAFAVPVDVEANWAFRLAPPGVRQAVAATRLAILVGGVLPVLAVTALMTAVARWPADAIARLVLLDACAAGLLVECLLVGWVTVPFTCVRQASTDTVRYQWVRFLVPLNLFVFIGAPLQIGAIASQRATLTAAAALVVCMAAVACWSRRHGVHRRHVSFEAPAGEGLQTLDLSEALR